MTDSLRQWLELKAERRKSWWRQPACWFRGHNWDNSWHNWSQCLRCAKWLP